jgi:hypothetical protein
MEQDDRGEAPNGLCACDVGDDHETLAREPIGREARGACEQCLRTARANETTPARDGEWVSASTSSGYAIVVDWVPMFERS